MKASVDDTDQQDQPWNQVCLHCACQLGVSVCRGQLVRFSMAPIDNVKANCLCGSVVVQTMVSRRLFVHRTTTHSPESYMPPAVGGRIYNIDAQCFSMSKTKKCLASPSTQQPVDRKLCSPRPGSMPAHSHRQIHTGAIIEACCLAICRDAHSRPSCAIGDLPVCTSSGSFTNMKAGCMAALVMHARLCIDSQLSDPICVRKLI